MSRVSQHIKDHRREYLIGVGCLVVGGLIGAVVVMRKSDISVSIAPKGIFYKSPVTTEVHLERRGHPGNVIQCVETGEIFASQGRAADLLGISKSNLSKYFKGDTPSVNGLTFVKLGEAQ